MTIRRTPIIIALLGLLVAGLIAAYLLLPPAAGAAGVHSRFDAPAAVELDNNQVTPQISQGKVAWREVGEGDFPMGYVWSVGAPAVATWDEFDWCSAFDYANWDPGDVVVWWRGRDEAPDEIWVTNGTLNYRLAGGVNEVGYPRIDGTIVVWQERDGGDWDIRAAQLDIDTLAVERTLSVCSARGDQTRPDCDSGLVVWQDRRNGQWDIYGRDLNLGGTKRICGNSARQTVPRIADHWVAWEDNRNRGYGADVYGRQAYCASADNRWVLGTVRAVCHARGDQLEPDVGDGFVVWTDWRNADDHGEFEPPNTDIRAYDIPSGDRFLIAGGDGMQRAPDIEYSTLVYSSYSYTHHTQPWGGHVKGATLEH